MRALDINALPTPKQETWKYTNLGRALSANLALADAPEEIVIHKKPKDKNGEVCERLEDILLTGVDGAHSQPRLRVTLEEGAQMTLVERHEGAGAYWKNMATEIILKPGAVLKHIRLQHDSFEAVQTNMARVRLGRDAVYNGFTLNMGGALTRHEVLCLLEGDHAQAAFAGLNLLGGAQHGDTTILIEHQAPHGHSNQFYRSLLDGAAHGVFQGKVHVHKAAQKTDAYQLSNALLLSAKAEMDSKPELEIYADDVQCSHGSTCGQLDEEPLFYLRQRGLSEAQARMLLMQAFVGEAVDKVVDESLKTEILESASQWLMQTLQNRG